MPRSVRAFPSALMAGGMLLLGLSVAGLMACSGSRDQAQAFSPVKGQHADGWVKSHYAEYVKNPAGCVECHGSTTDPHKAGGISGVSCFQCHGSPDHPKGWASPAQHGRLGAQAAPSPFAGMVSCAKCHGAAYEGGFVNAPSCKSCHTKAPHPSRPWTNGTTSHTQTEPANAPACFTCHADGANSVLKPKTKPEPSAAPGCFNNTMCHGREI